MKKKYIVTGASGFLGTNVVIKLLSANEKVRILIFHNEKIEGFDISKVEVVEGDICDKDSLKTLFKNDDNYELIFIHCAGIITIASKNDDRVYNVNVNGTKNVVNLCKENHVKRLIYISSVHAFNEIPIGKKIVETKKFDINKLEGVYSKTKAEATKYVLASNGNDLETIVLHPSGIIGPNDYKNGSFTTLLSNFMLKKQPVIVKGGYDYVDVRDVALAIISATKNGVPGENYIISNTEHSIKYLLDMVADITNLPRVKLVLPRFMLMPFAFLAENKAIKNKETPTLTPYSLKVLATNSDFSHEKASKDLNFNPRPFEETVKDTISWIRKTKKI